MVAGLTIGQLQSTVGIHPTAAEEMVSVRRPVRTVGKGAQQQGGGKGAREGKEGGEEEGKGKEQGERKATLVQRVAEQLRV